MEISGGNQQLVVNSLPQFERSGRTLEIPSTGLTTKDITVRMTTKLLLMLDYARSIGYDLPPERFLEEAIEGWFKYMKIEFGVFKKEDNLRDLLNAPNVKVYVVREGE